MSMARTLVPCAGRRQRGEGGGWAVFREGAFRDSTRPSDGQRAWKQRDQSEPCCETCVGRARLGGGGLGHGGGGAGLLGLDLGAGHRVAGHNAEDGLEVLDERKRDDGQAGSPTPAESDRGPELEGGLAEDVCVSKRTA